MYVALRAAGVYFGNRVGVYTYRAPVSVNQWVFARR